MGEEDHLVHELEVEVIAKLRTIDHLWCGMWEGGTIKHEKSDDEFGPYRLWGMIHL